MNAWHITADEILMEEQDEENLAWLWLAENTGSAIRYLTLTRELSSTAVYLECDEQTQACHAGIARSELSTSSLKITLNHHGQNHLGGLTTLQVSLPTISPDEHQRLQQILSILLVEKK